MRSRRRTPAGGVQTEKQQLYVRLIAQGVRNAEACRLVGINRKTGNRWRYGRSVRNSAGERVHYAPVKITEPRPRSPRYLSERERIAIADLLRAGVTVRGIAAQLGRSPSTVSREIGRNSDPDGRYRPHHAEHAARARACKPRSRRVAVDLALAEVVTRLLSKRGARRRSRTSCAICSLGSAAGGCAPSRSIRRSMTPRLRSPAPRGGVDAGGVCVDCSDEDG
jgi:IS30 family transposase